MREKSIAKNVKWKSSKLKELNIVDTVLLKSRSLDVEVAIKFCNQTCAFVAFVQRNKM